jgi:predicted Zn-dependent protease with MMP-like domain
MIREAIEEYVNTVLDELPTEFAEKLQNVVIVVEDWPTPFHLKQGNVAAGMTLFGLYQGVPLTKRGNYFGALPDKITIFAGPIVSAHGTDMLKIKNQVKETVLHEIGHYFGMSELEIRQAQHHTHE